MKILIVDDSKAMRMIVKRTLKDAGFGDHVTAEAANGKEGLTALHADKYDLVLCDWNMPEMSGTELMARVAYDITVAHGLARAPLQSAHDWYVLMEASSQIAAGFEEAASPDGEAKLDGNQVVLEEEMMKMNSSASSYDAAVTLYQQSLTLLRTAARAPGK